MDRRARFFLLSAVLCVVLLWPCPPEFRWVGIVLTSGYVVLAVLSALDAFVRIRRT